jgi:hypothetical protein
MDPRGGNEEQPASWTARILASLALLLALVVVIAVVSSSVGDDGGDKRDRGERAQTGCQPTPEGEAARRDGYYVLQPNDDFASLAEITCVPVERIQELNPNLDPQLLPQGGCVDLRPDGCKALAEG